MVYGIFSGVYSDWECHGYFETEAEANEYCNEHNGENSWDNYYVKPMLNLAEGADPTIKRAYVYYIKGIDAGTYKRSKDDDDFSGHARSRVSCYGTGEPCWVVVYVTPENEHKVPKIAQDLLAEWKAKKEGIC